jgi:hypothetical protein
MEQAVIASGGPGAKVIFFYENAVNSPQGEIPHDSRPGDATADNEHFRFDGRLASLAERFGLIDNCPFLGGHKQRDNRDNRFSETLFQPHLLFL